MTPTFNHNGVGAVYLSFLIDPAVKDRIKEGDAVKMTDSNTVGFQSKFGGAPIIGRVEHLEKKSNIAIVQVSGVVRFVTQTAQAVPEMMVGLAVQRDADGGVYIVGSQDGRGIVIAVDPMAHTVDVLL